MWGSYQHVRKSRKGRVAEPFAEFHLFLIKGFVVLLCREADGVVVRIERLDDHATGGIAASGASGGLCEKLERSFCRTEIRHAETDVREHNAYQRHLGNVVAFGNHLRADQDVDRAFPEVLEDEFEGAFRTGAVAVEPGDASGG